MHAKTIIVDKTWVMSGSANWTKAAKNNVEHMFRFTDKRVVAQMQKEFDTLYENAKKIDDQCVAVMDDTNLGRKTAYLVRTVLSGMEELQSMTETGEPASSSSAPASKHDAQNTIAGDIKNYVLSENEEEYHDKESAIVASPCSLEAED